MDTMENRFLFRLWDREKKEMIYWDSEEHAQWIKDAMNGNDEWAESVILMQCTGLTEYKLEKQARLPYPVSVYGADIYEGDYLEFADEPGRVYEVEWIMGGFHACPVDQSFSSSSESWKGVSWKGVGHTDNRVLGNRHENPEIGKKGTEYKPLPDHRKLYRRYKRG